MCSAPEPRYIYVWSSQGLWHAQAFDDGHRDPSDVYTSTDRPDVLEQAGYVRHSIFTKIVEDRPDLQFGSDAF